VGFKCAFIVLDKIRILEFVGFLLIDIKGFTYYIKKAKK